MSASIENTNSSKNMHPDFESVVERILQKVDKDKLAELRRDFHTRLRITLSQPDKSELIEDLWNFFYDWCVFELDEPLIMQSLPQNVQLLWTQVKGSNERGLFEVYRLSEDEMKLKEMFSGKVMTLPKTGTTDFLGISKGDIIEGRLVSELTDNPKDKTFSFVRRPSFHPIEVHSYIKKKVKEFKKAKDFPTYQAWLWLLVGMYLKHRLYDHMPIDKIYDDNSRI